jgi:translation initiation factor 2 beta subunit (eIF-2beta)/eIF-5
MDGNKEYYDVEQLLDRAYCSFTLNKDKIKLVLPKLERKNDRKSYIPNFQDVCRSIDRNVEEVRVHLSKELQMETSIKGNGFLKINGIVRSVGVVETIIKSYVINHVMCKSCKSCKTKNIKVGRTVHLECTVCGSKQVVS